MPEFENIEAYETQERSGKTRISPVAPHSLRPVDFILRPGEANRRRRTEIPVLQPPPITIDPIDSRDLEREFRAADRAERAESRRRHGGPLTRAWKRLRRYFRTLFSSSRKTETPRPKGKGGKPSRGDGGPRGGRKDRRTRGGKGGPSGTGGGGGPGDGGKQRPRRPRGRRKGGPDGPGGGGGGRGPAEQAPAAKGGGPRGGPGEGPGKDGGGPKKRRRNRRNRGGGGGNPGGQGPSSNPGN
jgi:hypothetical protein